MTNTIKNAFAYKLVGVILYFFFSLGGISVLLLFSPKDLLFNENSKIKQIKLNLYKDFAKNIYENINTPLIKNLTITEDNEICPENFEELIVKNQYLGNFSKFYGNKSICIERLKHDSFYFMNLLLKESNNFGDDGNKKKCGKLIKNSNIFITVPKIMTCPLNNFEINSENNIKDLVNNYNKIEPPDIYLTPFYGNDSKKSVITNIKIINNKKLCLENKNMLRNKELLICEFPEENDCFIEDNFELIYSFENSDNYKLYPNNLAKWNLAHDYNIEHKFCNNSLIFNMIVYGYINFTKQNLAQFMQEFPKNDFTKNPLYKTYKTYNFSNNVDTFFYLISYNLFIWSIFHFIIQIMLYYEKKGIRFLYIQNGILLLFFKLLSLFGMIINYFCFYLKIEKVYLIMLDKPRNKVLELYSKSRNQFIFKIISICLFGVLIICIDFIVYFFTLNIQWGYEFKEEEEENPKILEKNNPILPPENHIIFNETQDSFTEPNFSKNSNLKNDNKQVNGPSNQKTQDSTEKEQKLDKLSEKKISLQFVFKDDLATTYIIEIEKNEIFKNAIKILKNTYSELKDKKMMVFNYESKIIHIDKSISDNGLSNNMKIIIISK